MSIPKRHAQRPACVFPRCTAVETQILQLRADGRTFAEISCKVGYNPRKVSDLYFAAMAKVVAYLEQDCFLRSPAR